MDPDILLHLAIIILASKFLSALSAKLRQPPVIGTLLLGVLAGPSLLNVIRTGEVVEWVAQIGVLFLLFEAGLETDLKRIREEARRAFLPAVGGVILPFGLARCCLVASCRSVQQPHCGVCDDGHHVSVSVVTLMDLGKMKGIEGRLIVNAAIIDDILALCC
jgi:Kef-type K+ transport system membrane component KefB